MAAARTLFAVDAQERALEFVVESDAELPRVEADARRLLQVLSNLLGNAMKFTPTGGRIALSARATDAEGAPQRAADGPGAAVRFAVSDTGPGIPAEDVAHVFDWFWHSRRQRRSGAGLGLAIADGLVRAHHGRLRLESRPGRGCTFWFTLPSADGRDAGAPAVRPASGPDAAAEAAAFTPARPLALVQ
jgi:signal transduction histidine kinase